MIRLKLVSRLGHSSGRHMVIRRMFQMDGQMLSDMENQIITVTILMSLDQLLRLMQKSLTIISAGLLQPG